MRSAPIGLRFFDDLEKVWQEAKESAWPTHRHELGIEGAQLIAVSTSIAATASTITPVDLANTLIPFCQTTVFQNRLNLLAEVKTLNDIGQFGNGIEAHESVVTALACFALYPNDYRQAISTAIWQGGDTDTIGAMTGALVGARIGSTFTADLNLSRLESGAPFLAHLQDIAKRLSSSNR